MSVHFQAGWFATDLGDHRPCRYTYELYDYDTLPVLDTTRFTGAFQWLGEPGGIVPEEVERLRQLDAQLAAHGLALPEDFIRFRTSADLHDSLDRVSATGCWSSLSEPLPSPDEPGAFLVRFFRDQQDCVLWYLYLRPTGEVFVVSSCLDYEYEYEFGARDSDDGSEPASDVDNAAEQTAAILWCAPSFEQFAYRFWVENCLWDAVNGYDAAPLAPALQEYLDHYATARAEASIAQ